MTKIDEPRTGLQLPETRNDHIANAAEKALRYLDHPDTSWGGGDPVTSPRIALFIRDAVQDLDQNPDHKTGLGTPGPIRVTRANGGYQVTLDIGFIFDE